MLNNYSVAGNLVSSDLITRDLVPQHHVPPRRDVAQDLMALPVHNHVVAAGNARGRIPIARNRRRLSG